MTFQNKPGPDAARPGAKRRGPVEEPEEKPSLPGLSDWGTVYWIVLAFFVLCILLMRALQEVFS
jgi:hypothetical protein